MFDLSKALNDCLYSDLYKEVHGFRPRNVFFASQEELDADLEYLYKKNDEQIDEDKILQDKAREKFERRLKETQALVANSTEQDAFRILLQADDIEENFDWYGTEHVEWHFNLGYGYLTGRFSNAKTLQEALA